MTEPFILPSADDGGEYGLFFGGEGDMSVVIVESVDLTCLGLDTEVTLIASAVEEYPMIEVLGYGIFIIADSRYVSAGMEVSRDIKSYGG